MPLASGIDPSVPIDRVAARIASGVLIRAARDEHYTEILQVIVDAEIVEGILGLSQSVVSTLPYPDGSIQYRLSPFGFAAPHWGRDGVGCGFVFHVSIIPHAVSVSRE
jgi:hypothetical protein